MGTLIIVQISVHLACTVNEIKMVERSRSRNSSSKSRSSIDMRRILLESESRSYGKKNNFK